jgi:hypothetical protein
MFDYYQLLTKQPFRGLWLANEPSFVYAEYLRQIYFELQELKAWVVRLKVMVHLVSQIQLFIPQIARKNLSCFVSYGISVVEIVIFKYVQMIIPNSLKTNPVDPYLLYFVSGEGVSS